MIDSNSPQILIVDDEPDGADVLHRILRAGGFGSTVANSAEQALDILYHTDSIKLAVIDLALPEMDGFELMEHIRATPDLQQLLLVAVTAYHTPELKFKALDRGFDDYLTKPIDSSQFLHIVQHCATMGSN